MVWGDNNTAVRNYISSAAIGFSSRLCHSCCSQRPIFVACYHRPPLSPVASHLLALRLRRPPPVSRVPPPLARPSQSPLRCAARAKVSHDEHSTDPSVGIDAINARPASYDDAKHGRCKTRKRNFNPSPRGSSASFPTSSALASFCAPLLPSGATCRAPPSFLPRVRNLL